MVTGLCHIETSLLHVYCLPGCGKHVDQVLEDIPIDQRCRCECPIKGLIYIDHHLSFVIVIILYLYQLLATLFSPLVSQSLGLVSPGAATDGCFFFLKISDDLF